MKVEIPPGTISQRLSIFVQDVRFGDGRGLTGLVFNTSGLAWYYWREDEADVAATSVTLATATRGTWASGGFKEKDSTNQPGFYELGVPNAALATGAKWVVMELRGAANMAPVLIEVELTTSIVGTTPPVGSFAGAGILGRRRRRGGGGGSRG